MGDILEHCASEDTGPVGRTNISCYAHNFITLKVYIRVYVCDYRYLCACIHVSEHACVCMHVCMCMHMYLYVCACATC